MLIKHRLSYSAESDILETSSLKEYKSALELAICLIPIFLLTLLWHYTVRNAILKFLNLLTNSTLEARCLKFSTAMPSITTSAFLCWTALRKYPFKTDRQTWVRIRNWKVSPAVHSEIIFLPDRPFSNSSSVFTPLSVSFSTPFIVL